MARGYGVGVIRLILVAIKKYFRSGEVGGKGASGEWGKVFLKV